MLCGGEHRTVLLNAQDLPLHFDVYALTPWSPSDRLELEAEWGLTRRFPGDGREMHLRGLQTKPYCDVRGGDER